MTVKKKLITLAAAAILSLSFALSGAEASIQLMDLPDTQVKDKIVSLYERGIIAGTSDGKFSPMSRVTTAQTIQLLVNAFDLNLNFVRFAKEPKATDYFSKADDNAWYANALIIASVNGVEINRDIDLNQVWTREQFTNTLVTFMEKHCNLPMLKILPETIADESQITAEYSGAVQRALLYGIVKLDEEGNFYPKDRLTRAEAAEQIYNALEYLQANVKKIVD